MTKSPLSLDWASRSAPVAVFTRRNGAWSSDRPDESRTDPEMEPVTCCENAGERLNRQTATAHRATWARVMKLPLGPSCYVIAGPNVKAMDRGLLLACDLSGRIST